MSFVCVSLIIYYLPLLEISWLLSVCAPVGAHLTRQAPQLVLVLVTPRVRVGLVVVLSIDVIIVDTRLLLNDLGPGAAAGHGAAQEHVDQQHNPKQNSEGYCQS